MLGFFSELMKRLGMLGVKFGDDGRDSYLTWGSIPAFLAEKEGLGTCIPSLGFGEDILYDEAGEIGEDGEEMLAGFVVTQSFDLKL